MKLVRAGELGSEKPGVIDDTGAIRDLSDIIPDWDYVVLFLPSSSSRNP